MAKARRIKTKPINLALQGGGAHGAFTWGVLDCLLEDGRVHIQAISGTSAGAMNAAVATHGLVEDGVDGARASLEAFWRAVSNAGNISPIKRSPLDVIMGNWSLDLSPGYIWFDTLSRFASPYETNPFKINPLRDIVEASVDFEKVQCCSDIQLFISATNVETGRVKVFENENINLDVIMASACLPFMFQAVEIDGVPYWDGGFMGNPVLFPFNQDTGSNDVVIVQINPIVRKGTPRNAREIVNRMNEITFNASLLKDLRAIHLATHQLDDGILSEKDHKRLHVHMIEAREKMRPLGASSKLNAEWMFLRHLFDIGRNAAHNWLDANFDKLGTQSTVDIHAMFDDGESGIDC